MAVRVVKKVRSGFIGAATADMASPWGFSPQ
jgi:hypothetical protein